MLILPINGGGNKIYVAASGITRNYPSLPGKKLLPGPSLKLKSTSFCCINKTFM